MRLLRWSAAVACIILGVLFAVWAGMGVSMLWFFPARRGADTYSIVAAWAGLSALCVAAFNRLRR